MEISTNQKIVTFFKPTLVEKIEEAFDEQSENIILPWLGPELYEIMADAAIAVILGMADGQRYMEEQGYIKD